ncbi:NAD(P)/FAD-dependent oxidoreductase [Abyssibius alkaniclasticus]|uniref:NAD(P)/FAD-dependent oxidoreductase n=1 Tax=Abyssibius alkaniclasticus TaxID=2881234 RepID=UPI004059E021
MLDLLNANDQPGQYPAESYYTATADFLPQQPALKGETRTDICIIGAGYTGLSAALHLRERGYDVVVLEAQRIGFGASGRNGGQVGSGQRLGQDVLEKQLGQDAARAMWDIAQEAKATLKSLINKHKIACDLTPGVLHAAFGKADLAHAHAEAEHLATRYDYSQITPLDAEGIRAHLGTEAYSGGNIDMGAAHLHPLNYALGLGRAALAAGVRIHERSRVMRIDQGEPASVHTDAGQVRARFVVVAGNGYLGGLVPQISARVMPINNFIVATEPLGDLADEIIKQNIAVADSKFVVNYYRLSADKRMLWGGGESYGYRFPRNLADKARKPMLKVFPQLSGARIDYAWGGTLAITTRRMPAFQRISGNILSVGGYSGSGVAMATQAGKLIAEAIAGQAERFDLMASFPVPSFPGGRLMRWPILVLGMTWFSLRDRF